MAAVYFLPSIWTLEPSRDCKQAAWLDSTLTFHLFTVKSDTYNLHSAAASLVFVFFFFFLVACPAPLLQHSAVCLSPTSTLCGAPPPSPRLSTAAATQHLSARLLLYSSSPLIPSSSSPRKPFPQQVEVKWDISRRHVFVFSCAPLLSMVRWTHNHPLRCPHCSSPSSILWIALRGTLSQNGSREQEKKTAGDERRGGNSSQVPKSKRRERSVGEEENGKGAAGDAGGICGTLQLEILSPVMRDGEKKSRKDITDNKRRAFLFFHFLNSVSPTLYCLCLLSILPLGTIFRWDMFESSVEKVQKKLIVETVVRRSD